MDHTIVISTITSFQKKSLLALKAYTSGMGYRTIAKN
jgi:hypothetical protein